MLEFFVSLILGLVIFALICVICAIFIIGKDFPYYNKVYRDLPNKKFYKFENLVYASRFGEKDGDQFIWFSDRDDFLLGIDNVYLHNATYTKVTIYGWYWLRKYQKWFKENVKIDELPRW